MHTEPTSAGESGELRRVLASRHVSMISIGGIIGAGLFAMAFTPSMVREFWTSMATLALALLAAWLHGRRKRTAAR